MKRKIYVVGHASDYANWMQGEIVNSMKDADLVLFTGGEDVNPKYYGANKHPTTGYNDQRDQYEIKEYLKAKELNKPCIGICRGLRN